MKAFIYLQSISGGIRASELYIKNHLPEIYIEINQLWPELKSFKAKALACKYGFNSLPVCRVCGILIFRDDNIKLWQNSGKKH